MHMVDIMFAYFYTNQAHLSPCHGNAHAALFFPASEQIFRTKGLKAFLRYEKRHRKTSMTAGPFAQLLLGLAGIQKHFKDQVLKAFGAQIFLMSNTRMSAPALPNSSPGEP